MTTVTEQPTATHFKIGNKQYLFKDVLGRGTFGTVFLGICSDAPAGDNYESSSSPQQEIAIKEIARSKIAKTFPAEVLILKKLQHPNIIRLYTVDESYSAYIYLALEYCRGGDLKAFMQKHVHLTEDTCRRLFQDLVEGLHFLYQQHLIHRDIKPQNLLLSGSSDGDYLQSLQVPNSSVTLKIADFGSARYLHQSSLAFTVCGSPLYMAPEVLQCLSYDHKSDLWSAGTVLYEMICGKPAFVAETEVELLRQIKRFSGPKIPRSVSIGEDCLHLLRGLLVVDPKDRFDHNEFYSASRKFTNERQVFSNTGSVDNVSPTAIQVETAISASLSTKFSIESLGSSLSLSLEDLNTSLHVEVTETNIYPEYLYNPSSNSNHCDGELDQKEKFALSLQHLSVEKEEKYLSCSQSGHLEEEVLPMKEDSKTQRPSIRRRKSSILVGMVILLYSYLTFNTTVVEVSQQLLAIDANIYTVEERGSVGYASNRKYPPLLLLGIDICPMVHNVREICDMEEVVSQISDNHDTHLSVSAVVVSCAQEEVPLSSETSNKANPDDQLMSEFSSILRVLEFLFLWISAVIFFFYALEHFRMMSAAPQEVTSVTFVFNEANPHTQKYQLANHVKWEKGHTIKAERM